MGSIADPRRLTATTRTPALSASSTRVPAQLLLNERSTNETLADGSTHSTASASGSNRRSTRSVVHIAGATVAMPKRWYTAARCGS